MLIMLITHISFENAIESVKSFLKNLLLEAKKSELYSFLPCDY